jgi:hypothetical protein
MKDEDLEYLEEKFTTFSLDGQEFELFPGGKNTSLTVQNRAEYIVKAKHTQLALLSRAFKELKKGLNDSLAYVCYNMYTPEGLDKLVCGMNFVRGKLTIG